MDTNEMMLELQVVWLDEYMFELFVRSSNQNFSGCCSVYSVPEHLAKFCESLTGYPRPNQSLFFEAGERNAHSYFSMRFYQVGFGGQVGVEVILESNVGNDFRPEEKSILKMEIIVEPSGIDIFQKEIIHLLTKENGKATLIGKY